MGEKAKVTLTGPEDTVARAEEIVNRKIEEIRQNRAAKGMCLLDGLAPTLVAPAGGFVAPFLQRFGRQ